MPELRRLKVGTFSPSVVLRVAAGNLRAAGLGVTEVPVPSSPAQFRSLLGGEFDAVMTSPDNVVAYRWVPGNPLGRTADVRILLGVDRGLGLALYGRPDGPATVAGLRGRTVGVDVAASGFAFALYEILARAGLHRDRDYGVVELGSTPGRLDALLAGRCDATMLNAGTDLRARAAGCPRLRRAVDDAHPYLGTVLAATGAACDGDDGRLAGLVRVLRATLATLAAGGERDAAVAAAGRALRLPPDLAALYADTLRDPDEGLLPTGDPDAASLATVVALRRRHRHAPGDPRGTADPLASAAVADLVDPRFR